MSFTTLSIVKKHLLSSDAGALIIENVPVTLSGESEVMLPHQNLVESSGAVKLDATVLPYCDGPVVLTDYDKTRLALDRVVPGSVVVALSATLATVYVEEIDYKMSYSAGSLYRVPGGSIPNNQPVYVYYGRYTIYSASSDFEIDYVRGTVRRRAGSAIPDGADVLVDYSVAAGSVTDELISQAIVEAEDLIMRALSTDYNANSTQQGLQTGTTLLVLSVVARDMATETLGRRLSSDASGRAKEWQNLSTLYESRAWQTLRPYLDRFPMHAPERHTNG
ncbi:MAG TPA: hypothetical protein VGL38_06535 [bacterium]|jgi:hypothetical protein